MSVNDWNVDFVCHKILEERTFGERNLPAVKDLCLACQNQLLYMLVLPLSFQNVNANSTKPQMHAARLVCIVMA